MSDTNLPNIPAPIVASAASLPPVIDLTMPAPTVATSAGIPSDPLPEMPAPIVASSAGMATVGTFTPAPAPTVFPPLGNPYHPQPPLEPVTPPVEPDTVLAVSPVFVTPPAVTIDQTIAAKPATLAEQIADVHMQAAADRAAIAPSIPPATGNLVAGVIISPDTHATARDRFADLAAAVYGGTIGEAKSILLELGSLLHLHSFASSKAVNGSNADRAAGDSNG